MRKETALESYRQRYLELLGAQNDWALENRVVGAIEKALDEERPGVLPIRLSAIATRFGIRPVPLVDNDLRDGELHFDPSLGSFVIKLRGNNQIAYYDHHGTRRARFTYAHEFAHRFFYIQNNGSWDRAVNVATQDLNTTRRMRERVVLRKSEEAMCNNIARRVLIPDAFIQSECDIQRWFRAGSMFYAELSEAADKVAVSRDLLLVRLQTWQSKTINEKYCALIVDVSPRLTRMEERSSRIRSVFLPVSDSIKWEKVLYPGASFEKLGEQATDLAIQSVKAYRQSPSPMKLPIRISDKIKAKVELMGWSCMINRQSLLLWGQLAH